MMFLVLTVSAYLGTIRGADYSAMAQGGRVRSFPHVEGNYVVHVYIPGLRLCLLVLLQMLLFFDVNVHLEIEIKYI